MNTGGTMQTHPRKSATPRLPHDSLRTAVFCTSLLLLFCSTLLITTARAGESPRLFTDTISSLASDNTSGPQVLTVDRKVFSLMVNNQTNTIVLPVQGRDIVFFKKSFQKNEHAVTWTGMDKSNDIQLLLTLGLDHFFGSITTPDALIRFRPGKNAFETIRSTSDSRFEIPLLDDTTLPPPDTTFAPQSIPQTSAAGDSGTQIDVMILYTNGMASVYPGSQITTRIQYLIDQANLSFTNSNVNTRFRLVHSAKVNYADDSPGGMLEALEDLTNNNGVFAGIETERTTYGADQVTILRQFVDEGCGKAWLLTSDRATKAYAVVHDGSKTDGSGYYCSEFTYVHEVGHNLGVTHDRANSGFAGRFDYSYGYQNPAGAFRTVMAYNCSGGCPQIAFFSNPNVLYSGKPTGIAAPSPSSADNAKAINQTRVGMAGYRVAINPGTPGPDPGPNQGPFITPTNFLLLRN